MNIVYTHYLNPEEFMNVCLNINILYLHMKSFILYFKLASLLKILITNRLVYIMRYTRVLSQYGPLWCL